MTADTRHCEPGGNGSGALTAAELAVRHRYSRGARAVEPSLCCPTSYDPELLRIIPQEIVEKDYGCGDPSPFVREGQTVLDLGSGSGKLCYILAQIVGPQGRVIGVDFNDDMLDLANRYRSVVAERLGYANVEFRKGYIQNLRRDLAVVDRLLAERPPRSSADLARLEAEIRRLEQEQPLVGDESVDVVVSNCVLNLVPPEDKPRLFREIFRVLRAGGRAVISDIVADEDVPEHLQRDPELWSGCISGALREDAFLDAFAEAGFHSIEILKWSEQPWRIVEGIEFRSITVSACKGRDEPCRERFQAVIYRGPWRAVEDDDHHRYERGRRTAVCDKTYRRLREGPGADQMIFLEPARSVPADQAPPYDCSRSAYRHPREMKQPGGEAVSSTGAACTGGSGCC